MTQQRPPSPPTWAASFVTVGTTGTNGKTTTTGWIAAALRRISKPVARATTIGFYLDDEPFEIERTYDGFLRGMKECADRGGTHAAVEVTSEALAMSFAAAWRFKVGVFTNLTHDHLDAHGSFEHYLASKAQLFMRLPPGGTAVLNASDPFIDLLGEVIPAHANVLTYAVPARGAPHGEPDVLATSVEPTWAGTRIALDVKNPASGLPRELTVRGIGTVYAENAIGALLGSMAAGVPAHDAADAIAAAAPPAGRFEVIHEKPYVVVDYAHSPDALARTVEVARGLAQGVRLTAVFGAGGHRDREKREPMGAAARSADVVILTTDNPRDEDPAVIAQALKQGLAGHPRVHLELDRAKAIERAIFDAADEDVVLIAGKGHETTQSIGSETRHFSDVEVARAAVSRRSAR